MNPINDGPIRRRRLLQQATALAGAAAIAPAWGQGAYPNQVIRLVVGFPGGSTADLIFRPIAEKLSLLLGKTVIIDNRAGAAGMIAAEFVAAAAPDGYTLLGTPSSGLTSTPQLVKKSNVDVFRDFVGISMVTDWDYVLVASRQTPAKNLAELLAYAKANPKKLTYGSPGLGSALNMTVEILSQETNTEFLHIPYKGSPQIMQDLLGGQINFTVNSLAVVDKQIQAGQLKALGVTGARRNPALPDVPTFAESGVAGFEMRGGHMLVAPAKTPKAILDKLHTAVAQVMASPEIKTSWTQMGMGAVSTSLDETAKTIRFDHDRYGKIIRERKLYAD